MRLHELKPTDTLPDRLNDSEHDSWIDVEHEELATGSSHDAETDPDGEHDSLARLERDTLTKALQDRLDPVEHELESELLEHEVLPDTDWLELENDTLLI